MKWRISLFPLNCKIISLRVKDMRQSVISMARPVSQCKFMHLRASAVHLGTTSGTQPFTPNIMMQAERRTMKITIDEQETARDIEVTIRCKRTDRRVLGIVARLRLLDKKVTGNVDGVTKVIHAKDVLYVESVDKHTFIYTADEVFETGLRLYEMEEQLSDCDFMRIAKGCVINFNAITSLKPNINGRIIAELTNGERVVVSRQYAPNVKRELGLF